MLPSPAQRHQFIEEGYCVMGGIIPEDCLSALRVSCQQVWEQQVASMELVKTDVLGLTHKDKRYFLSCRHDDDSPVRRFLLGETMAGIVRSLLGDDAFLFIELFVVKSPRTGMSFGWHQDSGYLLGRPHTPYVSLWCAVDDATPENGALQVLPYDRAGSRDVIPHVKDNVTGDFVGYSGEDPGITVPVPSGSIVALSSTIFHRSGPNTTDTPRRAFLAAYSAEPITDGKGNLWDQAVPFLRNGQRVLAAGLA